MGVDAFVDLVTELQPTAPAYFGHDAGLNRQAHALHEDGGPPPRLDLAAVDRAVGTGAVVIDTRAPEDFAAGHLEGWINVGLGGRFAEQVGSVVPFGTSVVLVGDERAATEARTRLARIGFDDVAGYLDEPLVVVARHPERAARLSRLTATQLDERRAALGADLQLVDVRNPGEVEAAPVPGARNIPLAALRSHVDELDPHQPVVVLCAGGSRSAIAASLLRSLGYSDVSDVLGGATALGVGAACSAERP
jgi:hydroxyacylglutathione hydrolase